MNKFDNRIVRCTAILFILIIYACNGGRDESKNTSTDTSTDLFSIGPAVQYTTNGITVGKTAIGDLNSDGLKDAVTMESGGYGQHVLVYHQNIANMLDNPVDLYLSDTYIRSMALGDVNGDAKNDLVVSGLSISGLIGYLGRIVIYIQDTFTGELIFDQEMTISSSNVGDVVVADINSDGRDDIAVLAEWNISPDRGTLSIFYQQSDGTLAPETIYDYAPVKYTGEIHVADMDNDGDNDIVFQSDLLQFAVIKQNSRTVPSTLMTTPEYYYVQTSYWPSFYSFAIGDLNTDGRNDIVVLDPGNNGYLNLFFQNNSGTLDNPLLTAQIFSSPYGIEVADITGDDKDDILGDRVDPDFDPNSGGNILVIPQGKEPSFQSYYSLSFPAISGGGSTVHQALSVGDVNNDGFPDIVVTWSDEGLYLLPSVPN